MGFKVIF